MLLAVTPDGYVEGHYYDEMPGATRITCSFSMSGQVDSTGQASLVTKAPLGFAGSLRSEDDGVTFSVTAATEMPRCGMLLPPEINTGLALSLVEPKQWIGMARVKDPRAYLYQTPQEQAAHARYIVRADVVGILVCTDSWCQVEYISKAGDSHLGWVRQQHLINLRDLGASRQ
ncbi:SH3 domain-containing protein [Pseudomonas taiwanensis]|uniref:SH3 domain-containing protein n=1 Tax=Pseudomonas taiwanensis TaxID=470150 RepID=UPI0028DF042F|nr:SH3 domain-containing protein [Pseudomonas taiwanensis]MDT8925505.1 SH3 domain-containing protein [Pseudomonas taiwanensis]